MTTTRSVALLVLVAVVGLLVAPVASGTVVGAFTDEDAESEPNTTVSTFMQASAADAENTIDEGMFEAKYESADNESREAIVLERTNELEERLEELEAERTELRERKDELHPGEYQARMTQLTVEIKSLERSIDRTEQRAAETGVDDGRLAELRENASALTGPEVAEIARGIGADGIPGNGPPDDRGSGNGNGNGDDGKGNPPDHAGPPGDESGNGNGPGNDGTDSGNGNDPGNGNDGAGPNDE